MHATVAHAVDGTVSLLTLTGVVDEHFSGFGPIGDGKTIVLDVSHMARMTSFGVRQWRRAIDELPRGAGAYLVGCPTFFVDQLNMVLNFGGNARVLSVAAPYVCLGCGTESGEMIDILATRAVLAQGNAPEKECARCGSRLELDETPESYFSFVTKYGATTLPPEVARVLADRGVYTAQTIGADKPPRIIKLVHGSVTYFRIIGSIGALFRARPLLVGAEGEVVIDLAAVDHVDAAGIAEWKRLLKALSAQVPAVTLVDVSEEFLSVAAPTITLARTIAVASVLVPYRCAECGRASQESHSLAGVTWPLQFAPHVCPICGGSAASQASEPLLAQLQKAATTVAAASASLIARRDEVLSRALTDANVARAGESATASLGTDDTILGKYKIVRPLSSGGMADVFLAKQVGIGGFEKPVALKRIQRSMLQTRKIAIDMFLNEAKIAGRLMHPNIVQVIDVGEQAGALYLAMEYVRGRDLRDVTKKLREKRLPMPLGEACFIIREVAQALHHAYWSTDLEGKRLNVVHRDVSPHNVMLGFGGSVKLLDFGVALSAVTEHEQKLVVGKWLYMAPEAAAGQGIDHRSDLFSLGVIAYLLFTSTLPFSGTVPKAILAKMRAGNYKPLADAAPELPPALAKLATQMLAPDPRHRPQTGHEIVAAINEATRSCGIECSAADMSSLLANLFPEEHGELAVIEVTRASNPDVTATVSPDSDSPRMPPDVSVTIAPRSRGSSLARRTPSQIPIPATPRPRPSASQPVATSTGWMLIKLVVLLAVLAVVGYLALQVE